ncbi:unnamed protein product [Amaranthus hypochondriacus]
MGNFSSCLKPYNPSNTNHVAKLVNSHGQVKLIELPITTAELMVENPGYAIVSVEELRRTHRIPAMSADNRLLGGKIYLLVPFDKVNSRLTDLQLAALENLICSYCDETVGRRARGGSKVSPVLGFTGESRLEGLVKINYLGGKRSFCKVWEPVLEPIAE